MSVLKWDKLPACQHFEFDKLEAYPTDNKLEAYPTDNKLEAYPTDDKLEAYPTDNKLEAYPTASKDARQFHNLLSERMRHAPPKFTAHHSATR